MPTYRTEAIVLGRSNLGEADRIVTFLTENQGKLRGVVRGARKIKSRLAGHIEPFSRVNLGLVEGKGALEVVTSAQLVWYPHHLGQDLTRLETAFLLARLTDRLVEDRHPQPRLFHLMAEMLRVLDSYGPPELVELTFKLQLLAQLGYALQLDHCVVCGNSELAALVPERGGMVCSAHLGAGTGADGSELELWRLLRGADATTLSELADAQPVAAASLAQIDEVYDHRFGRHFTRQPIGASA